MPSSRPRVAGFDLTFHAMERMVEMDVTLDEVEKCLRDPEQSYDQPGYGEGSRIYQRGRLAVATVETATSRAVKSVLWRTQGIYTRKGK